MADLATRLDPRILGVDRNDIFIPFRECTPKILVVTDGLNYAAAQPFGLSQFVSSLTSATIHGMTPTVVKASRAGSPGADITNFNFTDATRGLDIKRYDVLFLFGIWAQGVSDLPEAERNVIARFMQAGGGVFATGDHETLGASLSSSVPRVRAMRKWVATDTPPDRANTSRHSTNWSGSNESEEFADQSDAIPQRLYVNYRTLGNGIFQPDFERLAHPVLQLPAPRKVVEVFPDHPHEGECVIPAAFNTSFKVDGQVAQEWPSTFFLPPRPELAAYSMSHGDGFENGNPDKSGLVPKCFGAIATYNGQRAGVGRVVTDATWHHFVNINLDGSGSGQSALRPGGVDSEEMTRIRQYYVNLATWLMPKNVRRCLFVLQALDAMARFPLYEELQGAAAPKFDADVARTLGRSLLAALRQDQPAWIAEALADDALTDALGEKARARLEEPAVQATLGAFTVDLAHAAVGGMLASMIGELNTMKSLKEIRPHESFVNGAVKGAAQGVNLALAARREQNARLDKLLSSEFK